MGMSFDDLKSLLDKEKIQYFIHPQRPVAMFAIKGRNGPLRFTAGLQLEGDFLQFSSVEFVKCSADNPNFAELISLLSRLNMGLRWIKWFWDPRNAEVVVVGDMWIMDSLPTESQFRDRKSVV